MQWEIHLFVAVYINTCYFKCQFFFLFDLCHCFRLLEATWDAIVNNTGIDDSRCTTQKAVACMYSRFQKSCNIGWWWKMTSLASQT